MRSRATLAASAALLATARTATANLSKTGNITLFSDTICADAVFVNSWVLGSDFCAKVDDSASWPVDVPFQSYILNERPWCDNGSKPYLNVYRDEACAGLIRSYEPGASYQPTGPAADGTCVAPGEAYKAMAFVCEGFEGAWGSEGAPAVASSTEGGGVETSSVESWSSSVETTVAGSSATEEASVEPTLSVSGEISASTTASTTASTASVATSGTASLSATDSAPTPAFTGAGSILGTHALDVVVVLPLAVLLASL